MSAPTPVKGADASLSLLQRLVDDAMDPGYRRAAESAAEPAKGVRHSVAIAVLVGLLSFLVVAAILQVRAGAPSDGSTRADLTERVQDATNSLTNLENQIDGLATEVEQVRTDGLAGTDADQELAAQAEQLEASVGGATVTGPGVIITLQDGPPTPAGDGGPDLARVLDTDIQLVVNGLFASGAEAVSVNGQRVTVLSPIRSAGEAVLVGFRPLTPPYEVSAVGPDSLPDTFESSVARTELAGLEAAYGIGVDVSSQEEISVPGRADLSVRYAEEGGAK